MSSVNISIKGLDKLGVKLAQVTPAIKRGIYAGTVHIKGKIAQYPPSTAANSPKQYQTGGHNTWYERGWGSKWAIKAGGWHGRKSSEQLGQKWTTKITNNGFTGIIGNNASYAPYVQGAEEQARALKVIGWRTTKDVAEEEAPRVVAFIQGEIQKELNK